MAAATGYSEYNDHRYTSGTTCDPCSMNDPKYSAKSLRSNSGQETSLTLLQQLHADDQKAWDRLIKLYSPLIYYWCRRDGLREDASSDVLQEVFVSVSKAFKDFRRERPGDSFRGWLRVIARNKIRDHQRAQAKQQVARGGSTALGQLLQIPDDAANAPTEQPPLDAGVDDDEKSMLYRRALELLRDGFEEKTWKAFWRSAVDGLTSTAVAEELGMTSGAVRQAKYKIMRRLHSELGEFLQ